MQQEVIETVMNELLQEQKLGNNKLDNCTGEVKKMTNEIGEFREHLSKVKLAVPPLSTSPIEVLLMKHHAKMQAEQEVLRSFIVQERKRKSIKDVCRMAAMVHHCHSLLCDIQHRYRKIIGIKPAACNVPAAPVSSRIEPNNIQLGTSVTCQRWHINLITTVQQRSCHR